MVWLISFLMIFSPSLYTHSRDIIDAPKINFEKKYIKIGNKRLKVEVAKTFQQQQQGLMHRTELGENEGMIFVFDSEDYRSFWMKNTLIDLSIGYFNKNFELVEVIDMKATTIMDVNPPSYPTSKKAQYAVEVNKGWFTKNKIKLGHKLNWD
jgi:uncharacterized membrane protein (UPF0127 family)